MDSSIKALILCCLCWGSYASDFNMMLTSAEEAALKRAQEQAQKATSSQSKGPEKLRLDGIVYINQKSWTIWLNGRSIKPGQRIEALRILRVTPESVELIWCPSPDERHQLFLTPNEVFQLSSTLPETK